MSVSSVFALALPARTRVSLVCLMLTLSSAHSAGFHRDPPRAPFTAPEAEAGIMLNVPFDGMGLREEYYAEVNDTLYTVNTNLRIQHQQRFGQNDQWITLAGGRGFGNRWALGVDGGIGVQDTLYPRWTVGLSPSYVLGRGCVAGLGYRHTQFSNAFTDTLLPGIEYYWGDYRAAYTLFITSLDHGSPSLAHVLKLDHYYGQGSRIGIGASLGSGREYNEDLTLLKYTEQALFVDGRHWWREHWGTTWRAGLSGRANEDNDTGLAISLQAGLRYRY